MPYIRLLTFLIFFFNGFFGFAQCGITVYKNQLTLADTLEVRFERPCAGIVYQKDKTLLTFGLTKFLRVPLRQFAGQLEPLDFVRVLVRTGMEECGFSGASFYVDTRTSKQISDCRPRWFVNEKPYLKDTIIRLTDTLTILVNVDSFVVIVKKAPEGLGTSVRILTQKVAGRQFKLPFSILPNLSSAWHFSVWVEMPVAGCSEREQMMVFHLR